VSIISFGLGRFVSVTPKVAQAASKANELRQFVSRFVIPVVTKVDKGLEAANLLLITVGYVEQYSAIENSSMSDAEKSAAKKRLVLSALKTGAMIIGPKVIGHFAAKRQSNYHLEIDQNQDVHLKTDADYPHQHMDPSMANEPVKAKKPAANGHDIEVTRAGIGWCSPRPCSLLKKRYKAELNADPELKRRLNEAESRNLDDPAEAEKAAAEAQQIEKELMAKRSDNLNIDLNEARQKTIDYRAERQAKGESQKGGSSKEIFNIKESQWLLKRQQMYMNRTIIEQAQIVGVELPDGTIKPISELSRTGRTLDFVEVVDNQYMAGDLKSTSEFLNSIKGGVKKGDGKIMGDFRPKSKVGGQHSVEEKILEYARKHNGKIVVKGNDVRTGVSQTLKIEVGNYHSKVVVYGDMGSN